MNNNINASENWNMAVLNEVSQVHDEFVATHMRTIITATERRFLVMKDDESYRTDMIGLLGLISDLYGFEADYVPSQAKMVGGIAKKVMSRVMFDFAAYDEMHILGRTIVRIHDFRIFDERRKPLITALWNFQQDEFGEDDMRWKFEFSTSINATKRYDCGADTVQAARLAWMYLVRAWSYSDDQALAVFKEFIEFIQAPYFNHYGMFTFGDSLVVNAVSNHDSEIDNTKFEIQQALDKFVALNKKLAELSREKRDLDIIGAL